MLRSKTGGACLSKITLVIEFKFKFEYEFGDTELKALTEYSTKNDYQALGYAIVM